MSLGHSKLKWCKYCGQDCVLHVWPSDAWELAHGEMTMRMYMCEHLNSDDELYPVFTSLTPANLKMTIASLTSSLTPLSLILSSAMSDFNILTVYLFRYSLPSFVPQT